MAYTGEIISIAVAFSLTACALAAEVGTRHLGVRVMNVWRMLLAIVVSAAFAWAFTGSPLPEGTGLRTWLWLLLSGFVGYFLGDWCLFNSYLVMGSRYGQLFMTLGPVFTAIGAWAALDQRLSWGSVLAIVVTMLGIAISVVGGGDGNGKIRLTIPLKGVLFGLGAALGQGVGAVLSKIGMDSYSSDLSAAMLPETTDFIPFHSNSIRCIAGFVCFLALLLSRHEGKLLGESVHDHAGMGAMVLAVIFGPGIGVGFSLLALQYTAAGIASTLQAITPVLILLPSWWLFRQKITARNVVGAVISVIGVSLFFLL